MLDEEFCYYKSISWFVSPQPCPVLWSGTVWYPGTARFPANQNEWLKRSESWIDYVIMWLCHLKALKTWDSYLFFFSWWWFNVAVEPALQSMDEVNAVRCSQCERRKMWEKHPLLFSLRCISVEPLFLPLLQPEQAPRDSHGRRSSAGSSSSSCRLRCSPRLDRHIISQNGIMKHQLHIVTGLWNEREHICCKCVRVSVCTNVLFSHLYIDIFLKFYHKIRIGGRLVIWILESCYQPVEMSLWWIFAFHRGGPLGCCM